MIIDFEVRKVFLNWLPWLLMMKRPGHTFTRSSLKRSEDLKELELREKQSKSLLANVLDMDDDSLKGIDSNHHNNSTPPSYVKLTHICEEFGVKKSSPNSLSRHSRPELIQILRELRFITERMRREDEDEEITNDFKFAAIVVDRLCLIAFSSFLLISTCAILFAAPHLIA